PEINLSDARFANLYAQATYTTPTGEHLHGAPILFTLTIPKAAHNQAGAEAFVRFLLTSSGLLEKFGFGIVEHQVGGDSKQIPADLRSLCSGTYKP
ncbi:MAG TPA: molybdenum ABC transporter substrate-binding protein, partial [Thermoanaerobaculia bacterium]|nr:molybdenum ABC transporter substrate-binding protein [Thermoanaerobaculia bacterium]